MYIYNNYTHISILYKNALVFVEKVVKENQKPKVKEKVSKKQERVKTGPKKYA